MKVTDIDLIQTHPKNQARNRTHYAFYVQLSQITVYRVTTDAGLVGYGETRGPMPPRSDVDPVIGRDPFDFIGSDLQVVSAILDGNPHTAFETRTVSVDLQPGIEHRVEIELG